MLKAALLLSTWVEKIYDSVHVALPEEWEWSLNTLKSAEKVRLTPVDCAIPDHPQALH